MMYLYEMPGVRKAFRLKGLNLLGVEWRKTGKNKEWVAFIRGTIKLSKV